MEKKLTKEQIEFCLAMDKFLKACKSVSYMADVCIRSNDCPTPIITLNNGKSEPSI